MHTVTAQFRAGEYLNTLDVDTFLYLNADTNTFNIIQLVYRASDDCLFSVSSIYLRIKIDHIAFPV